MSELGGGSRWAFLSFLDLISCAFGAAVLIFVISAVEQQSSPNSGAPTGALMIVAQHRGGASPELDFEVTDPAGNRLLTSDLLPPGWLRCTTPAQMGGGACLVIPKPPVGEWTFRLFWTDATGNRGGLFDVEVFLPDGSFPARQKFNELAIGGSQRFSELLGVTIRGPSTMSRGMETLESQ